MRPHCLILFLAAARASRFLILRHGETNHNAAGIIQGSSDISRLTEKGHEQAQAAGIAIAAKSDLANIDRTFVSSLTRAQQTLDGVAAASKLPLPQATVLSELREIDLGSWEGRDKAELTKAFPDAYYAWKYDSLGFEVDGNYPVVDLWARARVAWAAMRSSDGSVDGMTLVVTHNACGQALLCTALGLDATNFRRFEFPNCGAAEVELNSAGEAARWRWRLPEEGEWCTAAECKIGGSSGGDGY